MKVDDIKGAVEKMTNAAVPPETGDHCITRSCSMYNLCCHVIVTINQCFRVNCGETTTPSTSWQPVIARGSYPFYTELLPGRSSV